MIIGISGYARSGKDTLGRALMSHNFYRLAFADPLKQAAMDIFGFTMDQVHGDLKEVEDPYWGFTPRWALQRLGTEGGREAIDKNIWVKSTMKTLLDHSPFSINYVITDVRFRNEAVAIHALGGIVVRIVRDESGAKNGVEGHASEDLSDVPYDIIVPNNGPIKKLDEYAQALANHCKMQYRLLVETFAMAKFRSDNVDDIPIKATANIFEPMEHNYLQEVQHYYKNNHLDKINDEEFEADVDREFEKYRETEDSIFPYN